LENWRRGPSFLLPWGPKNLLATLITSIYELITSIYELITSIYELIATIYELIVNIYQFLQVYTMYEPIMYT